MSGELFIEGIFKEELKNRFLCLVEVDGADTLCYIPSSCRLSNFVDLSEKKVLLKSISTPGSRTKYSVYALRLGRQYVLLNMTQSNRIIEDALRGRRFSFLGERKKVKRECIVDDYKCDLYIEESKTIIEIKSILSFGEDAIFPTVFSRRAIDQLTILGDLLERGYKVVYIFVTMYSGVKRVSINKASDEYYYLLYKCIERGMVIKGYSVSMNGYCPSINGSIDVII